MMFDFTLYIIFIGTIVLVTKVLGGYIFNVFNNNKTIVDWFALPLEYIYSKAIGVNMKKEQTSKTYFMSIVLFSVMSFIFVMLVLMFQGVLPLNPQHIKGMGFYQAFNTAISFVANTNWQSYAGEIDVSYFSQMIALCVQNFVSAAVGLSVAIALIRSVARHESSTVGNFWSDLGKSVFWDIITNINCYCYCLYITRCPSECFRICSCTYIKWCFTNHSTRSRSISRSY